MVAEAKDQTAGISQDSYVLVKSPKESLSAESKVLSLDGGYNLKVRKLYTIRKQRERWTEEEHQKFVEDLKLYGRAWPQIEEHVGTKTAIQIRSHAQKFFVKVSRKFDTDVSGSSTPIEIPPPRRKKKPLQPYPRKLVDLSKTEDIDSHQQETSKSPSVSVAERANFSPTSVLSNVAEMHKSRLSPTSCATDECSADLLFTENDRECMTSNTSVAEKYGSRSPMGSSASALNDKSITDQTAGASQDAYVLVRSQKSSLAAESKDIYLDENGYNLRIRKPYTIRKQRERWTSEEHQKFVEALKLYGRSWRQIEENVGTKTAIQIQSHAQKFFMKVSRDFDTDVGGSLTPVEIPPPRPKKKPLHPYPRKIVDSSKAEDVDSRQQETTNSPDVRVAGRENLFPASVLSNVDEMHNSCLSASSCATDECSADLLFSENDREYVTSNISDAENDGCRSPRGSSASAFKDKSITKLELFPQEEYLLSSSNAAEPYASIKLFGKTVVERDTMKLYIEVEENSQSLPPNVRNNSESNDDNLVQNLASNYLHSQVEFGSVSQCATPYSLSHLLLHNAYCHMENITTLPWCTWYQGVGYPYPSHCKIAPQNAADFPRRVLKDEEIQQGSSKNQSNPGKGFVPYKRCSAERDDKLSMSFLQGQDGQRDRVFS